MAEEIRTEAPVHATRNRMGSLWKSLKRPARLAIMAVAALTAVVIIWLLADSLIPVPMEVLFHRLDPLQANEVASMLEEEGIPYKITDGGSTILVPRDKRDRLRLTISPNLYAQGAGFALFENDSLVASDFERRVQWQIALEEELRRTITSIEAIDQARVHLVIPEGSLFLRERGTPSASIFLRLAPMASLSESQVRGIVSLVAGSVEGLQPENVNIVDSSGNILHDAFSAMADLPLSGAVEERMALKRQFERELENRIRAILEQIYGAGKALAMVTADLDFNTRETTRVTYNDEPVERSTQRMEERSEGVAPGGEVGDSNIPGYSAVASGDYSYERIEETINYEIGETREFIASAPGEIVRLSAAVVIDQQTATPVGTEQVSSLVSAALGLNEARGDSVTVQLLPFDSSWREEWEGEEQPAPSPLASYFGYAAVAVGLLLLLLLLLVFLFGRRPRLRHRGDERVFLEQAAAVETTPAAPPADEEQWRKELRRLAEEEPASVAQLIKTWLLEE